MERNIKVLVQSTQQVFSFTSFAETLGEVKEYLREQGVSLRDDDIFQESRSQGSYTTDSTPLPTNVPWKGATTNDLVFRVVAAQTKIESGLDRAEVVARMKELELEDAVKEANGRNWTQVPTEGIMDVINAYEESLKEEEEEDPSEEHCDCEDRPSTELIKALFAAISQMDDSQLKEFAVMTIAHTSKRLQPSKEYQELDDEFKNF